MVVNSDMFQMFRPGELTVLPPTAFVPTGESENGRNWTGDRGSENRKRKVKKKAYSARIARIFFPFTSISTPRTKVGTLHDGTLHPNVSRELRGFERIEDRTAARIPHHGMLGAAESIIGL
jgi:hypothetical protein